MPSVMRPDSTAAYVTYLEVQNLTVPSYMFPIYQDLGFTGVLLFTAAVCLVTVFCYNRATQSKGFLPVCSYGVLYYCALLSFFINFWFYLPVIFQLVFLKAFSAFVVSERSSQAAPPESLAEAECYEA
jgi:oligosaccharide repeat unit polymerase